MTTETVGIRELQQHSSRLVREVEQGDVEYRISVQGRDTGVVLTKTTKPLAKGVTAAEMMQSRWWSRELPESTRQALLEMVEKGRDAMGFIGE